MREHNKNPGVQAGFDEVVDSRPVRLYLAFNSAKEECMSEWDFPASFSREKSEER